MATATVRQKYLTAKHRATIRGIEWKLTFEEFRDWWGEDIAKRGTGPDDLQMCRYLDRGAYELGNIYKATRTENMRTAVNTMRNRLSIVRAKAHQAALDALPVVADDEESPDYENESISEYFERKGTKRRSLYG